MYFGVFLSRCKSLNLICFNLLINFSGDALKFPGKEGDIIYSKNNVCVHPSVVDGEPVHVPGYMTLHCQKDEVTSLQFVLKLISGK